jgi:cysteine-rich repeat protein
MVAVLATVILSLASSVAGELSKPGGAGHALLFRDHGVVIEDFQDLGENELTFEAWVRTSDSCHNTALFSYAAPPENPEKGSTDQEANHFLIYNQNALVVCHDFEYIDLLPDPNQESCYAAFNHSASLPNLVSRDGRWQHVAVTWTAANNGLTKIYVNGLLIIESPTGKTKPLKKGGALMLGAEQDCYGGCLDLGQGFHGEMDEVRVWRVARSQDDILKHMRDSMGLDGHSDLAAYWKMNDPDVHGLYRGNRIAKDSSGRGNDLKLATLPKASTQKISLKGKSIDQAGVLTFKNNYAMNQNIKGMPVGDFSVEFWARTPAYNENQPNVWSELFSYAAFKGDKSSQVTDFDFLDDAILIEKYSKEFWKTKDIQYKAINTRGSISISINSNRKGMGSQNENWIDYNVGWTDGEWHHIAATWSKSTGEVSLYLDGQKKTPFWVCNRGEDSIESQPGTGVHSNIATGTERSDTGSLVLGARQEGYGGNFSPQYSLRGDISQLRIWNRILSHQEVQDNMYAKSLTANTKGLVQQYEFTPENIHMDKNSLSGYAKDTFDDNHKNNLYFGADSPLWVYSDAPLANADGSPLEPPVPGEAGHALRLNDMQVLIRKEFDSFPSNALTVEFWMLSTDTCSKGVPISYAIGGYENSDNSLMIGDYNDWTIAVMEDEGSFIDHTSGIATTDGKWHHIAVTWESKTGETRLYDNGREVWRVFRAKGKTIPSGGTLVIGREQDCPGGCFDSQKGAAGDISDKDLQEYGAQDFFGLIDELRIWKRARSGDEIRKSMKAHLNKKGMTGSTSSDGTIDPRDPDLVAYYTFDEGSGYIVNDKTGRGHDLIITQPARWEVVNYFSVCGNGVLEGLEECDNGDVESGTGCSQECKVMDGWECTSTSPSVCWKKDGDDDKKPEPNPPYPTPTPSPKKPQKDGDEKETTSSSGSASVIIPITLVIVLVGAGTAAFIQRQNIYERFPAVEDFAIRINQAVHGVRYTFIPNRGLDMEHVDTASPDFTQTMPPPGRGTYSSIPSRISDDA